MITFLLRPRNYWFNTRWVYFFVGAALWWGVFGLNAWAQAPSNLSFRSFETTRLKATGGAGVASILMDEASLLNPASVAFFQVSSLYLQKSGGEFKTESGVPQSQVGTAALGDKLDSLAMIASDGNQRLSGSLSFVQQKEGNARRRQWGFASASSIGSKTSLGFSTILQNDELPGSQKNKQWRFHIGILHALNESFSLGLVALEPWKKMAYLQEANLFLGAQYVYQNSISLILDVGSNFYQNLNDYLVTRGAVQLKILRDLFLRVGAFDDRGKQERGNGIGIGWAGPKLVFELAIKNTKIKRSAPTAHIVALQADEAHLGATSSPTLHESSFSMAYHF